jgi:hypothetical protein
MQRHTYLLVPAPGRGDEAVSALAAWLKQSEGLPGFHGGAVLREYAGEFNGFPDVLTLTYDLDRDTRHAFWDAAKALPDPMRPDVGDEVPPDQSATIFGNAGHSHDGAGDHDHDHPHGHSHDEHDHPSADQLDFNRGGGLFARVLHVHSEILVDTARVIPEQVA